MPDEEPLVVVLLISRRLVARATMCGVLFLLSWFVLRTYTRAYDPPYGWSRMIHFGSNFAPDALPQLQGMSRYIPTGEGGKWGYDGQFYAQLAIDPSFERALDLPAYRARRIGLPAAAFVVGWGEPRRSLQAYALSNLFFWFVLLGTLCSLLKPRNGKQWLCVCASLLGYEVITSMEFSLVDLPAAALALAGVIVGS